MNRLFAWFKIILYKHRRLKRWQRTVTVLAAIITFVTTYALILPAITVEKNAVEDVGGMYLDAAEDPIVHQDDLTEEDALVPVSVQIAADSDNAVTFLYEDEEMSAVAVFASDEEIPDGAELVVRYVDHESEMYADLGGRAAGLLARESVSEVKTCAFYDFALVCDDVDVTPESGLADIRINFYNDTVEHYDDTIYGGKFGLRKESEDENESAEADEEGLVMVSADQQADDAVPEEAVGAENEDAVYEEELLGAAEMPEEVENQMISEEAMEDGDEEEAVYAGEAAFDDAETALVPEAEVTLLPGDELLTENADKSAVAELSDGIITTFSIKGFDLAENDSVAGLYAGVVAKDTVEAVSEGEPIVLNAQGEDYTVKVTCDAGSGVPEGASLEVSEITEENEAYQRYLKETKKVMGLSEEEQLPRFAARFFDIKIMVEGVEFLPESGVTVEISYAERLAEEKDVEVSALHFTEGTPEPDVIDANVTEISDDGTSNVEFTAEAFSVYGVVYTVDYHWIKDGQEYVYKIAGGTAVDFRELVKSLGIIGEPTVSEDDASKELDLFINNVKDISFSRPEYVWVGKLENDMSVPDIIRENGLNVEYSIGLSEAGINRTYHEGAWVLVALLPFRTTEYLTVTMSDGSDFVIVVTDENDMPADGQDEEPPIEQPDTADTSELHHPEGNKELVPNEDSDGQKDGTYKLTLSVKGYSNSTGDTDGKKANVLFVMDRSSSMITKFVTSNEEPKVVWYYGTRNTSSFRNDIVSGSNSEYSFYADKEKQTPLYINYNYLGNLIIKYNNAYGADYPPDGDIWCESRQTRMYGEQTALKELFGKLMAKNTVSNDDAVEISVISFSDERYDNKSYKNETEVGWTKGANNTESLESAIKSNRFTSGTNWEEAMQYAYDIIKDKKDEEERLGKDEDYFVIFLTDGEPTGTHNHPGAYYYPGVGHHYDEFGRLRNTYEPAYDDAKGDAKTIVDLDPDNPIKFYNIFTYRTTEQIGYSVQLTNYAYGNGDSNDPTTPAVKEYFSDARDNTALVNEFNRIFHLISESIGHANVSITDTLTTDAMTTTVVQGKTNGYVYSVTDSNDSTLFTATARGDLSNPQVYFKFPDDEENSDGHLAQESIVDGKKCYTVSKGGEDYKIALADINDTTGELTWDLSPVGYLMNECTYSVSFVVWPDQKAYDYVAALNNDLTTLQYEGEEPITVEWNEDNQQDSGKGYYTDGVATYPSIVKYKDGTYAVLTNKDQKVHYSVVETTSDGINTTTTVTGPFYQELPLPEPMRLTAAMSALDKKWNVNLDPSILFNLLYRYDSETGEWVSREFALTFDIYQDAEEASEGEDTEEDEESQEGEGSQDDGEEDPYTSVHLGWQKTYDEDGNEILDENDDPVYAYVWDEEETFAFDGQTRTMGTKWSADFSIATGLMLSEARMNELGLDTTAYSSGEYEDPVTHEKTIYYLLEEGHDYIIEESSNLIGYEFDFISPIFHPMLVDGRLMSVNFELIEGASEDEPDTIAFSKITSMETEEDAKTPSVLSVANTLRGYLNLNKVVVEKDGTTLATEDDTEFTYKITLYNKDAPFVNEHIPWYAVNGLFYHDVENQFDYYQVDYKDGPLKITTEEGKKYPAWVDGGGLFDTTTELPQTVYYRDETGEVKSVTVEGNQMTVKNEYDSETETDRPTIATAKISITQKETLSIGNVPINTEYTIVEQKQRGYELIRIEKETKRKESNGQQVSEGIVAYEIDDDQDEEEDEILSSRKITGTIVPNRNNNITYTNKLLPELEIIKTDKDSLKDDVSNKRYLKGARFQMTQLDETGYGGYKYGSPEDDEETDEDGEDETEQDDGEGEEGESGSGDSGDGDSETDLYYCETIITDENGIAIFKQLEEGFYEIKETKSPDGYVLTLKPEFIKFKDGVITRIRKPVDDPETPEDESKVEVKDWEVISDNDDTGLVRFRRAEEDSLLNDKMLVGNEPGATLPNTGGPGTVIFYLIGCILTVLAAAGIIVKRRRIEAA